METPIKLDYGQKHILQLVARDADSAGWTKVSAVLKPHIRKGIPPQLVEIEDVGEEGRIRLTTEGRNVLNAMAWL